MNKNNNSFDYIGAQISDNSILQTEISKSAFNSLLIEANRVKNTPYSFSRGNIFEFLEGSKLQVEAAKRGKIFTYNPVNAGRGFYQSPDDLSIFVNNTKYCFQAKVSTDANWIVNSFSEEKYLGMERITTSDMYSPVKLLLEHKINNGTISELEYDAYKHLKPGVYDPETGAMVTVSNKELDSFCGDDGKVDLSKVERYVEIQTNKSFLEECINNTKSVTFVSTIIGCIISSVKNAYKFYKNEQDARTTAKNIIKDTAKSAGRGLLSSSIANGFKYLAFTTNNAFFRENVNALVFANGFIDIGSAFIYFKKGEISYNDFIANVIGTTILTLINLGTNYCLAKFPIIKLVSTITINLIGNSIIKALSINRQDCINDGYIYDLTKEYSQAMNQYNFELKEYLKENMEIIAIINDVSENRIVDDKALKDLCDCLNISAEYDTYNNFIEHIENGDKITIAFKKRRN